MSKRGEGGREGGREREREKERMKERRGTKSELDV